MERIWPRRHRTAYLCLLLVLLLLCTAVVLRFLRPDEWHPALPSFGIFAIVAFSAIKCVYDLVDKDLGAERRLLSVAGFLPVSLFLLSFAAPASLALGLLVLATLTLVAGLIAAFVAGRKLQVS